MSDKETPTSSGAQVNHHFVGLVLSLHSSAWIHLGKVSNPSTNKTERNLEAAREVIDLLGALEEKSRGNRVDEEDRLMTQILTELRMNYVDELERSKKEKSADGDAADTEAADTEAADTEAADTEAADTEAADTEAADTEAADTEAADTEAADTEAADKGSPGAEAGQARSEETSASSDSAESKKDD